MGITVAEPCFESENESCTEFCAEGSATFELFLLRPVSDPQTACLAYVSVAPRHSTAAAPQDTTPQHTTAHHTTPLHTTPPHTTPHHTTPHHTTTRGPVRACGK